MPPQGKSADTAAGKKGAPLEAPIDELAGFMVMANRLGNRLQDIASKSEIGISFQDWLLLRSIASTSPSSMAKIGSKVGVTRQRVHQQVQQLQQLDMVSASGGEDARSKTLALTQKGRALLDRADTLFADTLAKDGEMPAKRAHSARRAAQKILRSLGDQEARARNKAKKEKK